MPADDLTWLQEIVDDYQYWYGECLLCGRTYHPITRKDERPPETRCVCFNRSYPVRFDGPFELNVTEKED